MQDIRPHLQPTMIKDLRPTQMTLGFAEVKEKMKKAGIENPAEHFKQKTIQVTGTVILFEKKPRISITEPEQIKVIDKKN